MQNVKHPIYVWSKYIGYIKCFHIFNWTFVRGGSRGMPFDGSFIVSVPIGTELVHAMLEKKDWTLEFVLAGASTHLNSAFPFLYRCLSVQLLRTMNTTPGIKSSWPHSSHLRMCTFSSATIPYFPICPPRWHTLLSVQQTLHIWLNWPLVWTSLIYWKPLSRRDCVPYVVKSRMRGVCNVRSSFSVGRLIRRRWVYLSQQGMMWYSNLILTTHMHGQYIS